MPFRCRRCCFASSGFRGWRNQWAVCRPPCLLNKNSKTNPSFHRRLWSQVWSLQQKPGMYSTKSPLEHVLIFPDFSFSDAGNQLCCAVFVRNIWAWDCIIFFQSRGTTSISVVRCICREAYGTEQSIRSAETNCCQSLGIFCESRQFMRSSRHIPRNHEWPADQWSSLRRTPSGV